MARRGNRKRKVPPADSLDNIVVHQGRHSSSQEAGYRVNDYSVPAEAVSEIALRLKYLVEQVIPFEVKESKITQPNSPIITTEVVETAKKAGGDQHGACVVFCLLIVKQWFGDLAETEIWNANLHLDRELACEILAERIIESESDEDHLMENVLLKRYRLHAGKDGDAANVVELAVDSHALHVISTSGYQRCISYLWRGWYVPESDDDIIRRQQSGQLRIGDDDEVRFIPYRQKFNTSFWSHFNPDRLRVPRYQNIIQVGFSFIYLILYTGAINSINESPSLDAVEILLYTFTFAFVCDELSKVWKVGMNYVSFWNVFNSTLYALVTISFVFRMLSLSYPDQDPNRDRFNDLGYNFLAVSAPMFWGRILLFLDSFRFFGAMLVVLKVMMKESILFFALLVFIIIGFLQAFIGLDQVDNDLGAVNFVLQSMANSIMGSPDFSGFDNFAPPFGIILYYIYTFVIMVILLNILIALYNSAYEDITGNALDEYMALFAQKTIRFVRAPDENVFIPPLNLIEMFVLILPFEWWIPRGYFAALNNCMMLFLYSPFLLITSFVECRQAGQIIRNRTLTGSDDHRGHEWEGLVQDTNPVTAEWSKLVSEAKPNLEIEQSVLEIRELKEIIKELRLQLEGKQEGSSGG